MFLRMFEGGLFLGKYDVTVTHAEGVVHLEGVFGIIVMVF
jgi:hypothetical protein